MNIKAEILEIMQRHKSTKLPQVRKPVKRRTRIKQEGENGRKAKYHRYKQTDEMQERAMHDET